MASISLVYLVCGETNAQGLLPDDFAHYDAKDAGHSAVHPRD